MRVFITASYEPDSEQKELELIRTIIKNVGMDGFCFATDYPYIDDPKKLMKAAQEEVLKSDILLYDATTPATGRLIEVGIAYQAKKKVITMAKEGTVIKDTLEGVSDEIFFYTNLDDLESKLKYVLQN